MSFEEELEDLSLSPEEYSRRAIERSLEGVVGLYVDPELETTAVCDLQRQLNTPSPFDSDRTIASRDDLVSYAYLFKIPMEGSDQELAERIRQAAPCDWIDRVYEWARQDERAAYHLNRYVTDIAMTILIKLRNNEPLSPEEIAFMPGVDEAIQRSPLPNRGFQVYRGLYSSPGKVGDFIILETPKSGSFSLVPVLSGYLGPEESGTSCCLLQIYVPANAAVSYHPSEDQVIFPSGAEFYIVAGPFVEEYPAFGEQNPLITYHAVYVGPPSPTRTGPTIYDRLPLADAYYLAIVRDLPFPYGRDPYTVLAEADQRDPSFIQRIRSGNVGLSPSELRLYLVLRGYDIGPIRSYTTDQILRLLGIRS